MAITAVVADDHPAVRLGVSSLLEGSDIKIVGEATTGQQAVTMTHKHKPKVLLLWEHFVVSRVASLLELREN